MAAAGGRAGTRRWLGPALMAVGLLVGALGGIHFSDCVLCTSTELGAWFSGTLIAFAGAVLWQRGGGRRPLVRSAIVLATTAVAFSAAAALRLAIIGLVMGGI